ncbi:MAG: peptidoglycan DD-metalloendopeptidase family protein [Bacteroidales bacterium]|nr:peptidoglycan DD-metalloendopeptidase family protein [Bacteroidales bacterium]
MIRRKNRYFYIVLLLFLCNQIIFSQTKKELEEKKNRANNEIENAKRLLDEIEQNKVNTTEKISILEKKIDAHQDIISTINLEIAEVDEKIAENRELIKSLEDDLVKLKNEYAKMVYYAYLNSKYYDKMMFVMASENFNQAYRRMKYMQQYSEYRKQQAEVIVKAQKVIHESLVALEAYKSEKEKLKNEKFREQNSLEKEKRYKSEEISKMSKEEEKLREEIKEKVKIAQNLDNEIRKIIEAERRKSANPSTKLTHEEKLLSNDFKSNKGKLPWPTERGIVTEKFGDHPHPVLPEIKIRNNGIDIATVQGSDVRAVFNGTVTKVIAILGANYTVIVKHGEYYTVYQNLINISVKQGQAVKTKDKLGTVFTDKNANKTVLHVEIWENLTKLDPELWLSN